MIGAVCLYRKSLLSFDLKIRLKEEGEILQRQYRETELTSLVLLVGKYRMRKDNKISKKVACRTKRMK